MDGLKVVYCNRPQTGVLYIISWSVSVRDITHTAALVLSFLSESFCEWNFEFFISKCDIRQIDFILDYLVFFNMRSESNLVCLSLVHHWGNVTERGRCPGCLCYTRLVVFQLQTSAKAEQSWGVFNAVILIESFVGLCCICQHSWGAVRGQCSCWQQT